MFAEDGRKCVPFGACYDALGVSFVLTESAHLSACARNTESRIKELVADLKLIVEQKSLSAKQAQRIRGRMQFADSQLFGRTSRGCLAVLSDFAVGLHQRLDLNCVFVLELFMNFLSTGTPRLLSPGDGGNV